MTTAAVTELRALREHPFELLRELERRARVAVTGAVGEDASAEEWVLTTKDNLRKGFKDPLLPSKAVKFYTQSYVGHNDAHNPLISPVFGNLRGLPPLLVHAGEDEILRDDAIRLASLAKAAGVDVRLEIYPRMWHVWQLNLALPQAVQSLDDIAQFLKGHMGRVTKRPNPGQPNTHEGFKHRQLIPEDEAMILNFGNKLDEMDYLIKLKDRKPSR